MFNIEDIQKMLPQRYPFLMIDRILELEEGKKVVAVKNVSINEDFFGGHFPGNPVMPGALIIEAMAQASIALFYSSESSASEKEKLYLLGTVKVRFLNPVFPGDQLKITIEPVKIISTGAIVNALAESSGKEVARGELSFSVK
ncbi:MAG: 3-hydroxyacyl-ACP dehydratase FabZ [Candidatus Omnitrophica bacterium]|nr:3-hydroxyacyl-ACP dehydratase FabZ [Candidatus Omnitrophota bacterium]